MSNLIATVSEIQSCNSLHIVKFKCFTQTLSMMSLDLGENIKIGTKVKLLMKPTHIAIAKNFSGEVSYSNLFNTTIVEIENGELLSSIKLKYFNTTLESIITVASSKRMKLKVGDSVVAFVKASELSIGEIVND